MTLEEWARGPQPASFDYECFTVLLAWSPVERRLMGYAVFCTLTPYVTRAFRTLGDVANYFGKAAGEVRGMVARPELWERVEAYAQLGETLIELPLPPDLAPTPEPMILGMDGEPVDELTRLRLERTVPRLQAAPAAGAR